MKSALGTLTEKLPELPGCSAQLSTVVPSSVQWCPAQGSGAQLSAVVPSSGQW